VRYHGDVTSPAAFAAPPWVVPPPAVAPAESLPAGFWRRLLALVVDGAIVGVLIQAGSVPAAALARWDLVAEAFTLSWVLVVPTAYFVLGHGTWGRTAGKALAGARVVGVAGEPVGYAQALVRQLAWWLSVLTLGVGFLMVAARADKRALHDFVAGTRVVRGR